MSLIHFTGNMPSRIEIYDHLVALQNNNQFLTVQDAAALLAPTEEALTAVKSRILAMVRDKQLYLNNEHLFPNTQDARIGMVVATSREFGWLRIVGEDDWFISPPDMKLCLPGELVLAFPNKTKPQGTSAVIFKKITLLKNVQAEILIPTSGAGVQICINGYHQVPVSLQNTTSTLADGTWVLGDFVQDAADQKPYVFRVQKVLSTPHPVEQIRVRALQDKGFVAEHDAETSAEALDLCSQSTLSEVDLTHLPLFSVDGASSQDLDDLITVSRWGQDGYLVHVGISDVARMVPVHSLVDQAAMQRATSVYLPGACYPMLPDFLSHLACSMLPGASRNAVVVEMYVDNQGNLRHYRFIEGVVRSISKMTYSRVDELMNGAEPRPTEVALLPALTLAYELEAISSAHYQGAEFRTTEYYAMFNEHSDIVGFGEHRMLRSNRMIEKLMVLANIAAASYLSETETPFFRHHAGLKPTHLPAINDFLVSFGLDALPDNYQAVDCESRKRALNGDALATFELMLRRASTSAHYHTVNSSHFGLGLSHYTHFTSPIRRAADLIVHRCIKARMQREGQSGVGAHVYTMEELSTLAAHFSDRSQQASFAESDAMSRLSFLYLLNHGDAFSESWNGVVTGESSNLLFIRIPGTPLDAALPKTAAPQARIGDTVRVSIENMNEKTGQISLRCVESPSDIQTAE